MSRLEPSKSKDSESLLIVVNAKNIFKLKLPEHSFNIFEVRQHLDSRIFVTDKCCMNYHIFK